jgi:predicted porin
MAQVTMSGYINMQYNKATSTAASTLGMNDAGLTFTASEDLGNGLKATGVFNLDSLADRANTARNGDSSISLSGGFGTVAATRARSSHMASNGAVFGAAIGKGFNDGVVFTRSETQTISLTSPELVKGLRVAVAAVRVNAAESLKTNVIGATYTAGPLSLGVQQKSLNGAATAVVAGTEDSQTEAFVRYNAGVALIGVGYGSKQTATGDAVTSYGVSVPMGAFTVGFDAASRGDAEFMNYGVRYALSKRTTLHVSTGSYQTTAANDTDQTRIRLAHSF